MGTKYPDLFAALCASFGPGEVKTRQAQGGRQLSYITARTVANRLDDVLGPERWWDEYHPLENSVICKLTIVLPDDTTITKCDAGGYAGMADQGDDDKSGFSDAFKRAAVKFGVGRHLYGDGVPSYARGASVVPPQEARSPTVQEVAARNGLRPASEVPAPGPRAEHPDFGRCPTSGKGMFAWTKDQEQRHEVGLLKYLNGWAKLQGLPDRMVDWDSDQVRQGFDAATAKLSEYLGKQQADPAPAPPPTPPAAPAAATAPTDLRFYQDRLHSMACEAAELRTGNKPTRADLDQIKDIWQDLDPTHRPIGQIRSLADPTHLTDLMVIAERHLQRCRADAEQSGRLASLGHGAKVEGDQFPFE